MTEMIEFKNVAQFNGTNFQAWKFQMRTIFVSNEILSVVDGSEVKPEEPEARKAWIKRDAKAMFFISSSMDPSQLEHLLTCQSSSEMWKKLSTIHEQRSESNKLHLMTKFHEYRMSTSDPVITHITRVENMARQLKDLGENVSDITIIAKIIGSLPSKFSAFISAWDSVEADRQTIENLTNRLVKEEARMANSDDTTDAFATINISRHNGKSVFQNQSRRLVNDKRNIECFYCHKKGHVLRDCLKRKRMLENKEELDYYPRNDKCDEANAFTTETILESLDSKSAWILDSAASKHMSFRSEWFSDLKNCRNEVVTLGNGTICRVEGHGTIHIKHFASGKWLEGKLENVLYVPSLKRNLFSVGACMRKNHNIVFEGDRVTVNKNKNPMISGHLQRNNLYQMTIQVVVQNEVCISADSSFETRHNRTLVEKARTMLHEKGLSKDLWAEAMNAAVYLYNITPSIERNNITPFEIWTRNKPKLHHLKIFGSVAFVHIPHQTRRKWDVKSKKMIFVGYQEGSTNYRLFDPQSRKVTISRDVVFKEEKNTATSQSREGDALPLCHLNRIERNESGETQASEFEEPNIHEDVSEEDVPENHQESSPPSNSPIYQLRNRQRLKKPIRYELNVMEYSEPQSYAEALSSPDAESWKKAIEEEFMSHKKNKTWTLELLPEGRKTVGSKWVFKVKTSSSDGSPRYKARLCAKGFTQKADLDYKEIFSPVVRYESIRALLAFATENDLDIKQFDVKTAFLYGDLEEEIYMDIPEGLACEKKGYVCRLLKSLYGLKQSSRQWNVKFDSFLKGFSFTPCGADPCVYRGYVNNFYVLLALYVDDGLLLAKNEKVLNVVIEALQSSFEINVLNGKTFVGIQIERDMDNHSTLIHQRSYTERLLRIYDMSDSKYVSTPIDPHSISTLMNTQGSTSENYPYREAMGSLMFLAQLTRPDIMFTVSLLSRFLTCYAEVHWRAVKRVLRYLNGTRDLGIGYTKSEQPTDLTGYSDADFAGDTLTRRSTTGYLYILAQGAISWCSQRQRLVSLSTTEAEYIAASTASRELIWLKRFLNEIGHPCRNPIVLNLDNQSAIKLVKNPELHKRTKHIDIHFHFIRERHEQKMLSVRYVQTSQQYADFLTKALPKQQFEHLLKQIGMQKESGKALQ